MTAFNVVRFRVRPGRDQEFLDAHNKIEATWPGLIHANIIKTGDRSYCIIAEWNDMDACIKARPNMSLRLILFAIRSKTSAAVWALPIRRRGRSCWS